MNMARKKIEMVIRGLYNRSSSGDIYTLQLDEVHGSRQLFIGIGPSEAQSLLVELRGIIPPRPLTYNLFASVLEILHVKLLRILIYRVENGVFYSFLYLQEEDGIILRVDSRTSDAVTLALRMQAPIFVYEEVVEASKELIPAEFRRPFPWEENQETLQEALQRAIDNEDYEEAARLRDQINRLKT